MNNDIEYENRQIIPRWVPFKDSCLLNQLFVFNSAEPNQLELYNYKKIIKDWESNKSLSYAIELIAASHILGMPEYSEYREAVTLIIADKNKNTFVNSILGKVDDFQCSCADSKNEIVYRANIHKIRLRLNQTPEDAILWIDLAYYYLLSGNIKKAEKCINISLNINSENYHIIRSAARFYVFLEEPEKALYLLRKAASLKTNPLVLASEISISEAFDLRSKNIKNASAMIESAKFSDTILSELLGTLATLEFNTGASKKGKKLLEKSLIAPNENTIAQIQFLSKKFDGSFDPTKFHVPCRYEADAWNLYQQQNYYLALDQAEKWFYFQPFSSRSAILYSYLQISIFEDEKKALSLIDSALCLSPDDFALLNNKAVALARSGDTDGAKHISLLFESRTDIEEEDKSIIKATCGLIAFREGEPERGRLLYKEAINEFKSTNQVIRECRAYYYLAQEEKRINCSDNERYFSLAREIAIKNNIKDIILKFA